MAFVFCSLVLYAWLLYLKYWQSIWKIQPHGEITTVQAQQDVLETRKSYPGDDKDLVVNRLNFKCLLAVVLAYFMFNLIYWITLLVIH